MIAKIKKTVHRTKNAMAQFKRIPVMTKRPFSHKMFLVHQETNQSEKEQPVTIREEGGTFRFSSLSKNRHAAYSSWLLAVLQGHAWIV